MGDYLSNVDWPTTNWKTIFEAKANNSEADTAFRALVLNYLDPIYSHLRRKGLDHVSAEDCLHDFVTRLLDSSSSNAGEMLIANAEPPKRFRAFLYQSIEYFRKEWQTRSSKRERREKPAGVFQREWVFEETAQSQEDDLTDHDSLEWAKQVLRNAQANLGRHYSGEQLRRYRTLEKFLTQKPNDGYQSSASELEVSQSHVRVMVHRLKEQFLTEIRQEILRTISDPDDLESEIAFLKTMLKKNPQILRNKPLDGPSHK